MVGLAAVALIANAAKAKKEALAADQRQLTTTSRNLTEARSALDEQRNVLAERQTRLTSVDSFLSAWSDVYVKGETKLSRGGQFTAWTNTITEGTGATRQRADSSRDLDATYVNIGEIAIPARIYSLEFAGGFESLLRVVGMLEQDLEMAGGSKVDFRVTDKNLTCSYVFAYPSLEGMSKTFGAAQ